MSNINTGGPAFPAHPSAMGDHDGMDLRDWFAGLAMRSLMVPTTPWNEEEIATVAYDMADAMLKAREGAK